MTEVVRPEHGARFLFERTDASTERVDYRVTVVAPEGDFIYAVTIALPAGAVTSSAPAEPRPDWFDGMVVAFAKTLAANHKDDSPAEWPKRLLRWRQK
jgi:hypothetical protein